MCFLMSLNVRNKLVWMLEPEEVITSIKIHYRPSTGVTIDEKVWKYRDEYAKPEAI